jgi:hypothetical protein
MAGRPTNTCAIQVRIDCRQSGICPIIYLLLNALGRLPARLRCFLEGIWAKNQRHTTISSEEPIPSGTLLRFHRQG